MLKANVKGTPKRCLWTKGKGFTFSFDS